MVPDREPRSYRGILIAAGIGALVWAVIFGFSLGTSNQRYDSHGGYTEHRADSDKDIPSSSVVKPAVGTNESASDDKRCVNTENQKDDCITGAAQASIDQARYARWQAWAGWIGLLVGGGTLVAAFMAARWAKKAAVHTAESVHETSRGAQAAEDAIKETRRIGEAQVRAYLRISSLWVKLDKNGFIWLVPKFINSGQSPALKIRVRYSVSLLHIATSAITKEEGKWTGWNETVPPGIEEYEGVAWHCPRQINDVLIQAWGEKGALVLTVRAEISSRDVFDIKFPISASFVSFVDHWDGGEFYRLGDANTAVAAFRGELAGRRGSD